MGIEAVDDGADTAGKINVFYYCPQMNADIHR